VILIQPSEALGVVGEEFLALEGDKVVERMRPALFRGQRERADHGEGGQQVRHAVFAHEP